MDPAIQIVKYFTNSGCTDRIKSKTADAPSLGVHFAAYFHPARPGPQISRSYPIQVFALSEAIADVPPQLSGV
jgi:hypothetical protein